jgi:DNA (cytosine-5)-methyltransferase 1
MSERSVDFLTVSQRSELMRRVRSHGTRPEVALISALQKLALSFETNCDDLAGKPDIVFRSKRLAVFIDGEFWHGGQWRKRGLAALADQFPDSKKRIKWMAKIRGNCMRDLTQTASLLSDGWAVIRLWAAEVESDASAAASLIVKALSCKLASSAASYLPSRYVGEFFAGIGLAGMGLKEDGWNIRFANDNNPDKLVFYRTHVNGAASYLDGRDIHRICAADVPNIALATACFPCTDLSLAGAQRGLEPGTESSAYLKFTSLLCEMQGRRPPLVVLENVLGMISSRGGADFTTCLTELQRAGYTVDPFILDAKWFVPQIRPRLFVVAVRNDLAPSGHVSSDGVAEVMTLRSPALAKFISEHPELPWSLRPLPSPGKRRLRFSQILDHVPDGDSRWWSTERANKLFNQMKPKHQEVVREMMNSTRAKYGTVFRRMRDGKSTAELRTDGLAGCLRTPKGGSARQILFRASNGKYAARLITPRECARLMGAENYTFPKGASVNESLFAFGDGVCVPVVRWISEHYLIPVANELIHGKVLRQNKLLGCGA